MTTPEVAESQPDAPNFRTAAQMVASQVQRRPEALALSWLDASRAVQCLNFKEIWEHALGVAYLIRAATEEAALRPMCAEAAQLPIPVLAVAIDDGPYLPIAELAGFLAGCCLTPIDPHDPQVRIAGVLEEIPTLAAVVCKDWGDCKKLTEAVALLPADLGFQVPIFDLSIECPLLVGEKKRPDIPLEVPPSLNNGYAAGEQVMVKGTSIAPDGDLASIAYLWYTSGSTGKPKGCLIPHRAFSNWCCVKNPEHGIHEGSVVLVASASTFDPSIGDIFATWAVGGCVAVVPRMLLFAHLGWVISRLNVSHLTCTPSLWSSFEGAHPEHPDVANLQVVCLGGERMPAQLLTIWAGHGKRGAKLLNTYGTTECTVWQTLKELLPDDVPNRVGKCLSGNTVRIVQRDPENAGKVREVADGEIGEILQGGVQVGMGYFRRPDRSAASFLHDAGPGFDGDWYCTGDGGRWDADHGLEVAGRLDSQIKIRGMRVELGDIEQAIIQAGAPQLCSNCCAALRDGVIQAFVQLEPKTAIALLGEVDLGEHSLVTEFLLQGGSKLLPRHMLPSKFLLMHRLPLGRTGKVDRNALPDARNATKLDRLNDKSTLTKLERAVATIWADVLGIDAARLGPLDHFLALGGNSVSILRVSRRLTAQAKSQGAVVNPDGPVAFALAPERLIHSPRLQQYCACLEKAGMTQFLLSSVDGDGFVGNEQMLPEPTEKEREDGDEEEEAAAKELRINYTKLLVTERRQQLPSVGAERSNDAQKQELDHAAWEQVPRMPGQDMLFKAAASGVLGIVAILLDSREQEADGNIPAGSVPLRGDGANSLPPYQRLGLTPLHVAVTEGHEEVMSFLLDRNADPCREDYRGCPPLHKAAERGSAAVIDKLLTARANLWALDRSKRFTALHTAAKAGNLPAVETLLEAFSKDANLLGKVDKMSAVKEPVYVNILDRWNRSPLHWTVLNAHPCCAERLVSAGATVEGAAVERGKFLVFASGTGCSETERRRTKRDIVVEDVWSMAQERFGEDGGKFGEILRVNSTAPAKSEQTL